MKPITRFEMLIKRRGPAGLKTIGNKRLAQLLRCTKAGAARLRREYMAKLANALTLAKGNEYKKDEGTRPWRPPAQGKGSAVKKRAAARKAGCLEVMSEKKGGKWP